MGSGAGLRSVSLCFVCLGLASPLLAIDILVPDEAGTIQEAIDLADDGDVVLVDPGTYVETIDFDGKAITVLGVDGAADTTIDGDGDGAVVTFDSGEDSDSILEGFTITGGTGAEPEAGLRLGGGIWCESSSPTILGCVITGNTVGGTIGAGGGISLCGSSATISDCTIEDNSSLDVLVFGVAGGIHISSAAGDGDEAPVPIIERCVIRNNETEGPGGGIGASTGPEPVVRFCTIYGNFAEDWGGGVSLPDGGEIVNCTVHDNEADDAGGGLSIGDDVSVRNCIVWGNTAKEDVSISGEGSVTFSNVEGSFDGDGNIDEDPLFVDAESGDYSLEEKSPCIDAGDPDDPADADGSTVDMGAVPWVGPSAPEFLRGDCNGDGEVAAIPDGLYLLRFGFENGAPPPCDSAADVNGDGAVVALSDALRLLFWQFGDQEAPPDPGPEECGTDPEELECEIPPECGD